MNTADKLICYSGETDKNIVNKEIPHFVKDDKYNKI